MDKETLKLLTDLHINNHRQGPGSETIFQRALELFGVDTNATLEIADIGCEIGSATIPLLQHTKTDLTAVELPRLS